MKPARLHLIILVIVSVWSFLGGQADLLSQEPPSRDDAVGAMHRAVRFFREHASAGKGGYVYALSSDLTKREGEGVVGVTTAWIEPPGTPNVGMAYLQAYRHTDDPILLDAAVETADALIRGQLRSGGWDNKIEFDPATRKKYAYRAEPSGGGNGRNTTTLDDDKTQSVIRFLMQLDAELQFSDDRLHEAVTYALQTLLRAQYPCGAWPQRFDGRNQPYDRDEYPVISASVPDAWSRSHPGKKYAGFYTLNDNTIADVMTTLLDAWEIYDQPRYRDAAIKGGDFLLLAQLPQPQPGWAQQYDRRMQPAWARKFEPPAVTGGESQGVMRTLIELYRRTAGSIDRAERFLAPIGPAIRYYRDSLRADGRLARFYELGTNRPLYFTKDYQLTYDDSDMPTHYAFIVGSKLDSIERELRRVRESRDEKATSSTAEPGRVSRRMANEAASIIESMDERGAWVEEGRLRYHGDEDPTRRVILSRTFADHLEVLSRYISATRAR